MQAGDGGCKWLPGNCGWAGSQCVYRESAVVVRKLHNRVYISIPNCHKLPTVMWVTCTAEEGEDLLHFRVSRGGSLAPTAHGIIGEGLVTMVTHLKHANWHKQQI